jgi:hypothetical protein
MEASNTAAALMAVGTASGAGSAAATAADACKGTGGAGMLVAAENGNLESVKELLAGSHGDAITPDDGASPLLLAAFEGQAQVITALLAAGGGSKYKSAGRAARRRGCWPSLFTGKPQEFTVVNTALLLAAFQGHAGCVEALLVGGANPDAHSSNGSSAVLLAAAAGRLECVQALIAAGADANTQNHEGDTALMLAAQGDHGDCVKSLLGI